MAEHLVPCMRRWPIRPLVETPPSTNRSSCLVPVRHQRESRSRPTVFRSCRFPPAFPGPPRRPAVGRTARRCRGRSNPSRLGHPSAPDDQRALGAPAGDETVGHRQGVDEARADGLHVERRAHGQPSLRWTMVGGGGEGQVRRGRRERTIRSTSCGVRPAASSALRAAAAARSETGSSGAAL